MQKTTALSNLTLPIEKVRSAAHSVAENDSARAVEFDSGKEKKMKIFIEDERKVEIKSARTENLIFHPSLR